MKLSTALILSAVVLCVSSNAFAVGQPALDKIECGDALQAGRIDKTHDWVMRFWRAAMKANQGVAVASPVAIVTSEVDRICAEQPGLAISHAGQRAFLRIQAHNRIVTYN